jgi:aryl-alcohol dehydrogenase-like predicted oxidoreductase
MSIASSVPDRSVVNEARLGFGTSALIGGRTRREALSLLDAAWDAGIRHFDTARLYGTGDAEGVVGEFARSRRDSLTIVTKCGIQPMQATRTTSVLKHTVRPLIRRSRRLVQASRQIAGRSVRSRQFEPNAVVASLHTSLEQLQCDFVDALLLHDCRAADWERDDTRTTLEALRSEGLVVAYGTATTSRETEAILQTSVAAPVVVQFNASVGGRLVERILKDAVDSTTITFGVLSHGLSVLLGLFSDPATRTRWEQRLDLQFRIADDVAILLLAHALWQNPGGVVVFSSGDKGRIARNVESSRSLSQQRDRMAVADRLLQTLGLPEAPAA